MHPEPLLLEPLLLLLALLLPLPVPLSEPVLLSENALVALLVNEPVPVPVLVDWLLVSECGLD